MESPPLIGGVFADRYELLEAIGRGGAAVVYRARDNKHDRDVAVKVLHNELTQSISAERFVREIGIAAKLTHPNILPLYDSGESGGRFYYVTPFIEGESLRDKLERDRQLPLREALAITRAVASALDCAHSHGIVHRDIKPENILLVSGQPLVSDFGIARVLQVQQQGKITSTGMVVGTPAYMSPEQAAGEDGVGPRSDIYSLGCVLYEMLAGEPPFRGASSQAIIAGRFTKDAPDVREARESVPDEVAELIAAMLARLPADRVQTAGELVEALSMAEAAATTLTGSTAEKRARRPGIRGKRRWITRGRVISVAAGIATLVAIAWFGRDTLSQRFSSDPGVKTLAVLPLMNLSGDAKQEYIADGMTDALITDLSQLPGVKVISRTSVMQYKMMRKPMRQIAQELNADALIEGSLTRQGEIVRVTANLKRGRDEQTLWSGKIDGNVADLLDLERQVGSAVAREIGARFAARSSARRIPVKPESQEAYLKGEYFAGQWRLTEAIPSFQRAVEVDPTNAMAYAGLARAYYFRAFFGEVAPIEAFSQMRRAAAAAVAEDPQLGEAYGLMALVNTHFDYDWTGAEQHFARALQLSPNNAQVHHDYAHFLLAMGRGAQSVEESRRAVQLDPANPMLTSCLGWHSLFDGQFDQSLKYAAEAQRMMPSYWAEIVQGWAQMGKGNRAEAVKSMRKAVALAPQLGFTQAALANALARNGEKQEAQEILAKLLSQSKRGYISAYDVALVYVGLGENDHAFEWLGKAIAERSVFVVHLNWDARLEPLRSDPRFAELVQRLGIPAATVRPPVTRPVAMLQ
jgi:eukaryotic-like serine/threonine-protein kinase